jgi:hypothetical protein
VTAGWIGSECVVNRVIKTKQVPREMTSPGSSSSDCNTDHLESLSTGIGNGAIAIVRNSVSVLSRCYTEMRRVMTSEITVIHTCQTTVHSKTTSMKRVKRL